MAVKFNNVQSYYHDNEYSIKRDVACYDRYTITNLKTKVSKIVLMKLNNADILSESMRMGIEKTITKYEYTGVRSSTPRVPRKAKTASIDENSDLNNLKLKVKTFEDEAIYTNNEMAKSQIIEMKDKATKPLDFNTPIPKSHNGYYFPDMTDVIVRRIAMRRNVWIGGETGCLTADQMLNVKVDQKLFDIIIENRKK